MTVKKYTKSDVEKITMIGYNYFKIEGQEYEEKKHNDINIFTTNRICSRKYNTCYKWKFKYWIQ